MAATLLFVLACGMRKVVCFDGFTSFTFGAQPGSEPRFSFHGFPGGAAPTGAVDNEEYYKVR